ncbi:TPA_asm: P [Asclepias syriaca virus 2]|uniref:P n=1 Tax=Asclepias syriaca virus 2 TaxID=2793723 RepID=A0A8D9UIV8_9RHAB|nr:P [Asclepias syriaca virus 2] [Asclepias syriaca virus 2]DAF42292.1 TPA_asm: P [Asclepias syriaca virus 2]
MNIQPANVAAPYAKYTNIPLSVAGSEVLTSKMASEVEDIQDDAVKKEVIASMLRIKERMSLESLPVTERMCRIIVEVQGVLHKNNFNQLSDVLLDGIVTFGKEIRLSTVPTVDLANKMDDTLSKFDNKILEFQKTLGKLRRFESHMNKVYGKADKGKEIMEQPPSNQKTEDSTNDGPPSKKLVVENIPEVGDTDETKDDQQMEGIDQEEDINSEKAHEMRTKIESYYGDPEYSSKSEEVQNNAVYYWLNDIMKVNPPIWKDDPTIYYILKTIIDKGCMIKTIRALRNEVTVTPAEKSALIESYIDCVNRDSVWFGKIHLEPLFDDENQIVGSQLLKS